MPFEALCQHLVQNQFTSDSFQGDSESHLFQWSTNIWETWPVIEGHNFKEDWDKEGHINHPKRSETALTTRLLVPLPCLRAPGRGVPGFLAGPALVGLFLLLLFIHDPNLFCQIT